jgi:hypothetical protein
MYEPTLQSGGAKPKFTGSHEDYTGEFVLKSCLIEFCCIVKAT